VETSDLLIGCLHLEEEARKAARRLADLGPLLAEEKQALARQKQALGEARKEAMRAMREAQETASAA